MTVPVIVVGLDGSPSSWDAFCWAAGHAARCQGRLVAAFVTPAVDPVAVASLGGQIDYGTLQDTEHEVVERLWTEAELRAGDLGVAVTFVLQTGGVARVLTKVARSAQADLIVVGRSAKVRHRLAGSLGRRLVLRHDAPVVVIVP